MKEKTRQYHCARCRQKITVCSLCDHGRIYCIPCATKKRKQSQCAASQKYQQKPQGKENHAKRQKRYRERQKDKSCVTHHTTGKTESLSSLAPIKKATNTKEVNKLKEKSEIYRCYFCNKEVSLAVKANFTRECIAKLIRGEILPVYVE